MPTVKVSKDFSVPSVQVRVAGFKIAQEAPHDQLPPQEAPVQPPPPQDPQASQAPQAPQANDDLVDKQKIIKLVQDYHNKIDKLIVVEEKGGKKKVEFEVSPQGILRPQPGQPAPATANKNNPNPWAVDAKKKQASSADKFPMDFLKSMGIGG